MKGLKIMKELKLVKRSKEYDGKQYTNLYLVCDGMWFPIKLSFYKPLAQKYLESLAEGIEESED